MQIEFVRLAHNACLGRVRRGDGAMVETSATAKSGLPHDLEHLIVDEALGIRDGFWGRIAAGAEFRTTRVTTSRPRRRPRSYNRALAASFDERSELWGGLVTSVFWEAHHRGWTPGSPLPRLDSIGRILARRELRPVLDIDKLTAICGVLHQAASEWATLREGQSLTYHYPSRSTR